MPAPRSEKLDSQAKAPINFFMLPDKTRNEIYERVLAVPHPLYMFQGPSGRVETFAPEKPKRWFALLYTNEQVSTEAIKVLYGTNHFILDNGEEIRREDGLLKSFLHSIGPVNAGLLSHLSINFPTMEQLEDQSAKLSVRKDSLQDLHQLQESCTGLKTLESLIYGQNARILTADYQNNAQLVQEILSEINSKFRGITSLDNIVVRICSGTLDSPTEEYMMKRLGWIVVYGSI